MAVNPTNFTVTIVDRTPPVVTKVLVASPARSTVRFYSSGTPVDTTYPHVTPAAVAASIYPAADKATIHPKRP